MRMQFTVILLALIFLAAGCASGARSGAAANDPSSVREAFAASMGEVSFYFKYDDGDAPGSRSSSGGSYDDRSNYGYTESLINNMEPLRVGAFLLTDTVVLTEDPMIPLRFIDRIEVTFAGSKYVATPDKFAVANHGIFLRLDRPVSSGTVLEFDAAEEGPYTVAYLYPGRDNRFDIRVGPLSADQLITFGGKEYMRTPTPALVLGKSGHAVGAIVSRSVPADDSWKGSPLSWPALSTVAFEARSNAAAAATRAALLGVTINLRSTQSRRNMDFYSMDERSTPTEIQAVGMYLGDSKVLVLADLSRRDTSRIEAMTLAFGEKRIPLEIEGALRRYGAFVARITEDIPGAAPLAFSDTVMEELLDRLLVGDALSYDVDARDEQIRRERISDIRDGFLGLYWPNPTGSAADLFLFDLDGKLVAVPIATREPIQMEAGPNYYGGRWGSSTLTMPAYRLAEILADEANLDTSVKPLSEDDSKRLAWLGLELQEISRDLARAKDASLPTKGGEVGAIVSFVYKDSPADKAGVKPGDIFLRFYVPGQVRPVDVTVYSKRDFEFPWAQLDRVADVYFEQLPRPWPSRSNSLTKVLTEVGFGQSVSAEFISDGKKRMIDFTLEMAPTDFSSADSYQNAASGLTVKDITYEVRQYFKMAEDAPGVVVAEIEPGSKASVAGIKPCEVITAVNGQPVSLARDFKAAVEPGGELALTVKRMSQSRVVKISLPQAEEPTLEKPESVEPMATDSKLTTP